MTEERGEEGKRDVVLVHAPTADGDGFQVLRARDERLELGEIRPMKEGRAIHGDVVRLKPREGEPRVFDVETLLERPKLEAHAADRSGPAQIATDAYREGWDAIFGTEAN